MAIVVAVIQRKIEAMYGVRAELLRRISVVDTGRDTLMFAIRPRQPNPRVREHGTVIAAPVQCDVD